MKELFAIVALLQLTGCVSIGHHQRKIAELRQQLAAAQEQVDTERQSCNGARLELQRKNARLRSFNQLNENGTLRNQE